MPDSRGFEYDNMDGSPGVPKGKNYLLAIGIDDYQHVGKLSNAVRDARMVSEILADRFGFKEIQTLFDAKATRRAIRNTLREQINRVGKEDNLVIYYSGHGHYDKVLEDAYWVPYDARFGDDTDYISYDFIRRNVAKMQAHHIFMIVDSCYSGAVMVRENQTPLKRLEKDPSRWILASGRNEVVPDGISGKNSPFATQLLDVLERYAGEGIRVSELVNKVTTAVIHDSFQTPIGRPLFNVGDKGGELVFRAQLNEEAIWQEAQRENTVKAYDRYLVQFPAGKYAEEALWAKAQKLDSVQGFLDYRRKYPGGRFYQEALKRIESLEEEADWRQAIQRNSIAGFERYLQNYPGGRYRREAEQKVEALLLERRPAEKPVERPPTIKQPAEKPVGPIETLPTPEPEPTLSTERKEVRSFWEDQRIEKPVGPIEPPSTPEPVSTSSPEEREDRSFWEDRRKWFLAVGGAFILILGIVGITRLMPSSLTQSQALAQIEENMVRIPGGTFNMGSESGDEDEKPIHEVSLSKFEISRFEVTQAQYEAITGENPSYFSGCPNCPVERVSWEDAQKFIQQLNSLSGKNYRLPTEAEWEYAAGGGNNVRTTFSGTNTADQLHLFGNFCDKNCTNSWAEKSQNDGYKNTSPVGSFRSNELGLYDLSGNVWEWCQDWKGDYPSGPLNDPQGPDSGRDRVLRGGSWSSDASLCRVSNRSDSIPSYRGSRIGFRVARGGLRK